MTIAPSKKELVRAGNILRTAIPSSDEYAEALHVLSDWRKLHMPPLEAFNTLLQNQCKALGLSQNAVIARRLKRASSVAAKLKRFPSMQLSQMQDIGGLRVVVPAAADVYRLRDSLLAAVGVHGSLLRCDDYIACPKPDGYRSLHLVFRCGRAAGEELSSLRAEVQIRTRVQHSWATAVEALGMTEKTSFKLGEGTDEFRRFFLLSSALLSKSEQLPVVHALSHISDTDLVKELEVLKTRFGVFKNLHSTAITADKIFNYGKNGLYYLLELNLTDNESHIWHFKRGQENLALNYYNFREQEIKTDLTREAVLISVNSSQNIKSAYPNYFLDCTEFIANLKRICAQITAGKTQIAD